MQLEICCRRVGSPSPVEYVELPGAHHDFDLYESIRSNAVNVAVDRFIAARYSSAAVEA